MEENFDYWINKGNDLCYSKDFEKAIDCYIKATLLNPEDASAFYNWGTALADLAGIKQDETLFRESFEKYYKATILNPKHTSTFNNWGIALAGLARIKQDEALFKESFEKYYKANILDLKDASVLNNWGTALADLAEIKQDEVLFNESFEKYNRATLLNPKNASAFYNWGTALSDLAEIKQDEALFKESFDKFDKAVVLNPEDASAFHNWGITLTDLARIKQDEALFRESFVKYDKATKLKTKYSNAYIYWGISIAALYKLTKDESLLKESVDCFVKSEKDILYILVFLDKKYIEYFKQREIYSLLLDMDTDEGRFFRETTKKNTSKEEINILKSIYFHSFIIISQLHINNDNEKLVAHYQKRDISQKMLFEDSKFRLNAINYSNDPTEGKMLSKYLFGKEKHEKPISNMGYGAFAGCFIFNHDSLNHFRLYGKEDDKEGTGVALVFNSGFFSKEAHMAMKQLKKEQENLINNEEQEKYALFRCIYIDPVTQRVETVGQKESYLFYHDIDTEEFNKVSSLREKIKRDIKKYNDDIIEVIKNIEKEMEELRILVKEINQTELNQIVIEQLLVNLRYLIKHIAFKEEQECRIIKIFPLTHDGIKEDKDNMYRMYIEYAPQVSKYIKKIYFGPKAAGMNLFQDYLAHKKLNIPVLKSENPLA